MGALKPGEHLLRQHANHQPCVVPSPTEVIHSSGQGVKTHALARLNHLLKPFRSTWVGTRKAETIHQAPPLPGGNKSVRGILGALKAQGWQLRMHPRSCFRKWQTSKSHLAASRGKREMTLRHLWPLTTEVLATFLAMPLKATSQLLGASSSSTTWAPEHLSAKGTKLSEVSCLLSVDRQYLRSDHVLHCTGHHRSLKCILA